MCVRKTPIAIFLQVKQIGHT